MHHKKTELRTSQFLLRAFEDSDLENVFRGLSDPGVIKHYGISYETQEAAREQMAWFSELEKNGTGKWWAICSPDNSIFYGAAGINNIVKEFKKGEMGFWLLPEYWGNGIIAEVFPLVSDYCFDTLGIHRIEGLVESDNAKCKSAMAKLGFFHEGTMRDCEIKNGTFISLDIYSKLYSDR